MITLVYVAGGQEKSAIRSVAATQVRISHTAESTWLSNYLNAL